MNAEVQSSFNGGFHVPSRIASKGRRMALTMSKTSRLPAHSEQELVGAIRAGDDRAFEELYSRYRERIFAFILSKVHDHGRAEDIAQEVFMSALRRLRSHDQDDRLQAVDLRDRQERLHRRVPPRQPRRARCPWSPTASSSSTGQRSSVSRVPTPAGRGRGQAAARGSARRLRRPVRRPITSLLVMREFEGLSYDEIGERLGMTRQMVESSLFRARRKLSEEYEELASGRRCEQIQTAIDGGRLRAVSALGRP